MKLTTAGIIAIPIEQKEEFGLGELCPNFLVIDQSFGNSTQIFEGTETKCIQVSWKIVLREILPETQILQEEYIEREIMPTNYIDIPINLFNTCLLSHQSIKENVSIINYFFNSLPSFRGSLVLLKLKVNEVALDEIILNETNQ